MAGGGVEKVGVSTYCKRRVEMDGDTVGAANPQEWCDQTEKTTILSDISIDG